MDKASRTVASDGLAAMLAWLMLDTNWVKFSSHLWIGPNLSLGSVRISFLKSTKEVNLYSRILCTRRPVVMSKWMWEKKAARPEMMLKRQFSSFILEIHRSSTLDRNVEIFEWGGFTAIRSLSTWLNTWHCMRFNNYYNNNDNNNGDTNNSGLG